MMLKLIKSYLQSFKLIDKIKSFQNQNKKHNDKTFDKAFCIIKICQMRKKTHTHTLHELPANKQTNEKQSKKYAQIANVHFVGRYLRIKCVRDHSDSNNNNDDDRGDGISVSLSWVYVE